MIASSTPVLAQARVIASSGGAVESYPKGARLANDTILLLGRGDSVTITVDNVKRTFPGPGKFPINRAVQQRSSVSILDSILNFITGDSAVASGAARGRSSSSNIASTTRDRATRKARTGAVRPTAMPPPPPPSAPSPPPPPPSVAYDMAPPEYAMDVPMPDVMPDAMPGVMAARVAPGGGGGSSTSTYAFSDTAPNMPGRQFYDIDIGKSENICLTPLGKLQLWRAVADDPLSINIIRQSDGRAIELTFDAYEQSKSWPEPFDAAPAGDYAIVNVADDTASLISIIPAGTEAENLGELAAAYSRNECTGQLAALETGLNTDGLEPTVAAVFGAGTR